MRYKVVYHGMHCDRNTSISKSVTINPLITLNYKMDTSIFIDFSLTVKAVTLIFIAWRCLAISSAKQEKSGSIYNLVKN